MKAFGLGKMTLRSVFGKPDTLQYPAQTKAYPAGFRGMVRVNKDDCVFCNQCAVACPAGALEVDGGEELWSVDALSCVQCGACLDACPQECLFMEAALPAVFAGKR